MREIKFRAWDKTRKKYFYKLPENHWMDIDGKIKYEWMDITDHFDLEQFTGMQDKTGVDIYEGDIIEFVHYTFGKVQCHIEFNAGMFQYYTENTGISSGPLNRIVCSCKVIGNIHEK